MTLVGSNAANYLQLAKEKILSQLDVLNGATRARDFKRSSLKDRLSKVTKKNFYSVLSAQRESSDKFLFKKIPIPKRIDVVSSAFKEMLLFLDTRRIKSNLFVVGPPNNMVNNLQKVFTQSWIIKFSLL